MEVILKRPLSFFAFLVISAVMITPVARPENGAERNEVELTDEVVFSKTLENGLVILSKECAPKDLVSVHVKILAGSSLESGGLEGSGVSHLVEHMLFKGSASRKPGDIEKEIKSYGGIINGSVSQDLADYNVIIPVESLEKSLELLKDMLKNASFDKEELIKEKKVISSEMRMGADDPDRELFRLLYDTAYIRHPYKHPPIGYEPLFERLTREDLLKFYRKMYVPNNMVISIVGGMDASTAMNLAEKVFLDFGEPDYGAVGPSVIEPPQIVRREREKEKNINLAYLGMGFHSTRLLDKDLFAMDVLSIIMGRADNSRLNIALKKNGIVHSISCWNYTPRDPGLFVITAALDKERLNEAIEAVMKEVRAIKEGPIGKEEVESAKRMVLADYIFSRQSIDDSSNALSADYILTGSYKFSERYVRGVNSVTEEDIRRAASSYLTEDNLTVVNLLPEGYRKSGESLRPAAEEEDKIKTHTLSNGLRFITMRDARTPTVSIAAVISGGIASENKENNGISNLTARMLLKGTSSRKEEEIVGAIEALGGSVNSFSGFDSFGINIEILKQDLDTALAILSDILTDPVFPEEELKKEKILVEALIKQDDDDIFNTGFNALRRELFAGTQYAFRVLGESGIVKDLTREDLLKYYNRQSGSKSIVISMRGDIKEEEAADSVKRLFSGIKGRAAEISRIDVAKIESVKYARIKMNREQSLFIMGFQTVSGDSPDRYALDVLGSILSGTSGRLFNSLRSETPMAYTLGCFQYLARRAGLTGIYAATTKDKIDEVKKALEKEISAVRSEEVSDEDLMMAKRELKTNFDMAMQSNIAFSQKSALDELNGLGADNLFKYKDGVDSVTKDDLIRAARKYFDPNVYAEVIITPE